MPANKFRALIVSAALVIVCALSAIRRRSDLLHRRRHHQRCAGRHHSRRHGHSDQRKRAARRSRRSSGTTGDFVISNVPADTYTIRVTMDGFKTTERKGVSVSLGERVAVGSIAIEVGTLAETVLVTGDAPMIQAQTGERSFTVSKEAVENLPVSGRIFRVVCRAGARRCGEWQQPLRPHRRRPNQLHARRHLVGQHGREPARPPAQRRRHRRGESRDLRLSGRVRPHRPAYRFPASPRAARTSSAGRFTTSSGTASGMRTRG